MTKENENLTENMVEKNTPMKLTIAQKKSVMVLSRHIDRFDFTTPEQPQMNKCSTLYEERVSIHGQ